MVLDLGRLPETALPGIASKTFAWPWAQLSEMRCTDASPVRKESKGDRGTPAVCALLMCVCVCATVSGSVCCKSKITRR